jgi:hypothetical protein
MFVGLWDMLQGMRQGFKEMMDHGDFELPLVTKKFTLSKIPH